MEDNIIVYGKVDSNNVVTEIMSNIESSIKGISMDGYVKIDEGSGDKYAHAQSSYLEKGLTDSDGKYNYKLVDNVVTELTEEEKATLFPTLTATQPLTNTELQTQIFNLTTQLVNGGVI